MISIKKKCGFVVCMNDWPEKKYYFHFHYFIQKYNKLNIVRTASKSIASKEIYKTKQNAIRLGFKVHSTDYFDKN